MQNEHPLLTIAKQRTASALLRAWMRYHKQFTFEQVDATKKRINKLLEAG